MNCSPTFFILGQQIKILGLRFKFVGLHFIYHLFLSIFVKPLLLKYYVLI
jgi:hypothetical protein